MNINDYKDGNGNVLVSETLVSDLIGGINGVVESGSNENGRYIKFYDGTMICTAIKSINFDSPAWQVATFPATFMEVHGVSGAPQSSYADDPVINVVQDAYLAFDSLYGWIIRFKDTRATGTYNYAFIAIGRWK